ncbi:MAG: ribonuclease P protein component [Actinomycetota bacterium]
MDAPAIRRALREGTPHRSERVIVYVALRPGLSRAAWVTGKRVGGAVARNRARRLLREAWRALWPGVAEGFDLVLVARGPLGGSKAPELIEEIRELFTDAGLMR